MDYGLKFQACLQQARLALFKVAPGPPPRPGLKWKEETHRWVRPLSARMSDRSLVAGAGRPIDRKDVWAIDDEIAKEFNPADAPSYVNAKDHITVVAYTHSAFETVNESLRFGLDLSATDQRITDGLKSVMQPMEEPQVLYRGLSIDLFDEDSIGEYYELNSFTSCSRKPSIGLRFARESRDIGTLLEIHTDPSTRAITLKNDDTGNLKEDETILDFGQKLLIESYELRYMATDNPNRIAYQVMYVKGRMIADTQVLEKGPPGPKPARFGPHVVWDDSSRKWVDGRKLGESTGEPSITEGLEVGLQQDVAESTLDQLMAVPGTMQKMHEDLLSLFAIHPGSGRFGDPWVGFNKMSEATQQQWAVVQQVGVEGRDGVAPWPPRIEPGSNTRAPRDRYYEGMLIRNEEGFSFSRGGQQVIEDIVAKATPLGVDVPLYRGIELAPVVEAQLASGRLEIDWPTATSTGLELPWLFSRGDMILEIRGAQDAPVLTENQQQTEVVIAPGGSLRVIEDQQLEEDFAKRWVVVQYEAGPESPVSRVVSQSVDRNIAIAYALMKTPPGPPPRLGLRWREETHRWYRPKEGSEGAARHAESFISWLEGITHEEQIFLKPTRVPYSALGRVLQHLESQEVTRKYTGDYATRVNAQLRNHRRLSREERGIVQAMDTVMRPFPVDIPLYRSISKRQDLVEALKVGQTYTDPAFISTATREMQANLFGRKSPQMRKVLFEFQGNQGMPAVIGNTGESEIVIGRGHTYRILEIVPIGNAGEEYPDVIVRAKWEEGSTLMKTPPGPPPRPGLGWKEETHRWVRPEEEHFPHVPQADFLEISPKTYSQGFDTLPPRSVADNPIDPTQTITAETEEAVREYTGVYFSDTNARMRDGISLDSGEQQTVDRLLEVSTPINKPFTVYRGMRRPLLNDREEEVEPGDIVEFDAFTSTSRDFAVANTFLFPDKGVMMELRLTKGVYAISLADSYMTLAAGGPEYETILEFGQQLVIEEVHENVLNPAGVGHIAKYIVASVRA